jgi:signal transduction histidine kinase
MITAYASIETAITATKRGAYDFLPKPFTPAELKNTVRKAATHLLMSRQARRLAEEKKRVRFEFIRVLGHELKSPINAVEGYLQLLLSDKVKDEEKRREMLSRSLRRIESMRKLILDLLDMTKIEAGQKTIQLEEVDLVETVRAAVDGVKTDAAARDIEIELHAEEPAAFRADRTEIEMVANNLVSNAVKYNRDGGRVDIAIRRDGPGYVFVVSDTGIGLSEEEAGKLFQDFVRIKNEKTQGIHGSGLGLSIVRKIALLHGGDATVESVPDEGSTFTVTFPRDRTGHPAAAPAAEPGA